MSTGVVLRRAPFRLDMLSLLTYGSIVVGVGGGRGPVAEGITFSGGREDLKWRCDADAVAYSLAEIEQLPAMGPQFRISYQAGPAGVTGILRAYSPPSQAFLCQDFPDGALVDLLPEIGLNPVGYLGIGET